MIENIAIWGGVAGLIVSLFAIIILFLTKQRITTILNKDRILFDESFKIKKESISKALSLVDELEKTNGSAKNSIDFENKARESYNDLLCVISDVRIADEFYNITINTQSEMNRAKIAQFKLRCRKDIGLKIGKAKTLKRVLVEQSQMKINNHKNQTLEPLQPEPTEQSMTTQPAQTIQPKIVEPQINTQSRPVPVQPRPIHAQPRPTTAQPREVSVQVRTTPAQASQTVPTRTVRQPQSAVRGPGRPPKNN